MKEGFFDVATIFCCRNVNETFRFQTQRAYNYSCLEDNKSSVFMQFRCAVYIAWLGALTNYKLR
jgi:hypothetical protein